MFSIRRRPKKSKVTFIQVEPSSTTVINRQLETILKPLNIMQNLILSQKYKIQDDVITPNSIFYRCLSLLSVFMTTSVCIYSIRSSYTSKPRGALSLIILISYMFSNFIDGVGYWLNFFTNVKNRQNNVFLFLKLQNAFKFFKIDGIYYAFVNWTIVVAVIGFYIFFVWFFWLSIEGFDAADILVTGFFIIFDLNILYASRLLNLLSCCLEMWVKNVNSLGYSDEVDNETYWIRIFNVFLDVLDAYQLIQKTFQTLVSILKIKIKKNNVILQF